jgi:hypothetical protein
MKSTSYDTTLLVITVATEVPHHAPKMHFQAPDQTEPIRNSGGDLRAEFPHRSLYSIDAYYPAYSDGYLLPYTTVMVWRKLPNPIRINNKLVLRYKAPSITEYLDPSTGEIISASILKNDTRVPLQNYFGEIQLLRQYLMDSLRPEVKGFALFVLRFRNNRRGITPEISTLVEWYARLHNKRPSNVRRYVEVLEKAGFLAGSSLLSRLFQHTGKRTAASDHLGEDVAARRVYFSLSFRAGLGRVSNS